MIEIFKYDITVIGSGVAGLSFVKFINELYEKTSFKPSIALLSKAELDKTNTNWAQGGIAAAIGTNDSYEKHIEDTLKAGDYQSNPLIVEKVIKSAPFLMKKLISWGMNFDRKDSDIDLTLEGGHSAHRILHYKDSTGEALQKTLLKNISKDTIVLSQMMVTNITKDDFGSFHLSCLRSDGSLVHIISKNVVLSTGGLGMMYERTTNQDISTGDGIFLASRLKVKLKDLSFIQFHPSGFYNIKSNTFLISEAVRGEGAILRNIHHDRFMTNYDMRAELAPRDIVSRSIFSEMKKTNTNFIYLDGTHLPEKKWHDHFPSIYKMCIKNNIDPTKDFIPISPVQHYSCGGIQTDEFGKTNVKNLFAIGEVACTGLHGSNRLASNSLLEGLALGYFCAEEIYKSNESAWKYDESFQVSYPSAKKLDRFFLQKTMTEHVGIIKNKNGLIEAYNSLTSNYQNAPLVKNIQMKDVENEMMYNVAILLVKDALNQKKNSGVYYNENYV